MKMAMDKSCNELAWIWRRRHVHLSPACGRGVSRRQRRTPPSSSGRPIGSLRLSGSNAEARSSFRRETRPGTGIEHITNIFFPKAGTRWYLVAMSTIEIEAFGTAAGRWDAEGEGGRRIHRKRLKRLDPEKEMKGNESESAGFRAPRPALSRAMRGHSNSETGAFGARAELRDDGNVRAGARSSAFHPIALEAIRLTPSPPPSSSASPASSNAKR